MADKPILIFPAATVISRPVLTPAIPQRPPRSNEPERRRRLAARFQALSTPFGTVQINPEGADPEQVIVLETVGSLADFQNVVKRISGMEWLGDFDVDVVSPDPGFLSDGTDPADVPGRLFVVAANRTAYVELLRLWNAWNQAADEKLPRNYGALAEAFKYLNDVRPWSAQDRVGATGVIQFWERGLAANVPTLRFEAELWCRVSPITRDEAYARVSTIVGESRGQCLGQIQLPEIDYHGVLLEVPGPALREAVDALATGADTRFLRMTDVKYFAPTGQASIGTIPEGEVFAPADQPLPAGAPVAALLDGLPLSNHEVLQGRLRIDDPDDFASLYQVGEHRHGTAMASLITHDELDSRGPALASSLYVRPVMHPVVDPIMGRSERFPPNVLTVDLIHRAVRRIVEGDGALPAQAPTVRIINLSLGDSSQLFDRQLSPWARLLDWLAWKHRLLFVVSAGNHDSNITIPVPPNTIDQLIDDDLRAHVLRAMAQQRLQRRLVAPAEAVNVLTVGALHAQSGPVAPQAHLKDLMRGAALPGPFSSVTSGFRRSIKPEILVPGGRRHYSPKIAIPPPASAEFEVRNVANQPGQLVATPGGTAVPPTNAGRTSGTSNAAALTTRQAVRFAERIEQMRADPGGEMLTDAVIAVALKAMLVHGASWGEWKEFLDQVFFVPENGAINWRRAKHVCAQYLGYGPADFERGSLCTDQRAILLGVGELAAEEAHRYEVPLPTALHALRERRRLTITLAWLSPMNPRHRSYRVAELWFDPPNTRLQVQRRDADHDAVTRSTIQHEILEGEAAVPIAEGDTMPVQVNCKAAQGAKIRDAVPYALMVSLETARPLPISVYEQVKIGLDRIRALVRVRPDVR